MSGDDREPEDPDRAAILARRRRFVALAISGLATTGCKQPGPEPCLSIQVPDPEPTEPVEPVEPEPFIEDPCVPLESGETGGDESGGETGEALPPTPPEVCLKVSPKPKPRPCLNVARPRD